MKFEFKKLSTLAEMIPQLSLIRQLSPNLTADEYEKLLGVMIPHHYYQLVVFADEECIAVSGYWIGAKLYCGPYLEIDNFVIDEKYRSGGIGSQMIAWLEEEAVKNNCSMLMLDAYVENFKAHKFYYKNGFIARGFHYLKKI